MANQNAQEPAESAYPIFDTVKTPPPDPAAAPVLRPRQPTAIPKLQGRQPISSSTAAGPAGSPAPAGLAKEASSGQAKEASSATAGLAEDARPAAQSPPTGPERAARKKLPWLSGAVGLAVVVLATGVLLSGRGHAAADESTAALPGSAASGVSALPPGDGAGSIMTPAPVDSLSAATEAAATHSAATHSAPTHSAPTRDASPSPKASPAAAGLPNPAGVDLALHKPVTASGSEGANWAPAEAVDGDPTTRWSSAFADSQWIRIDLGALRQISQVRLTWERSYAVAFQVQTSADGQSWKDVYRTTNGRGGTATIETGKAVGRYLRVYCTKRVSTYGYSLFEIDVR